MPGTYAGTGRVRRLVTLFSDGDKLNAANINAARQELSDTLASVLALQVNFTTKRVKATTADLNGIGYGRQAGVDTWVAVGDGETASGALILVSNAGEEWQEVSNPKDVDLYAVAYDPVLNLWAAVGAADGGDGYIVTQSNPRATWNEKTNPEQVTLLNVASNGAGVFVAVGNAAIDGNGYILRSTDGNAWLQQECPVPGRLIGLVYANGLFVAAGGEGTTARVITSPDGETWTERATPGTDDIDGLCWNGEVFLTISSAAGEVLYSSDGTSWGLRALAGLPAGTGSYGIFADPTTGVVLANPVSHNEYYVSFDNGQTFRNMGPADSALLAPLTLFGFANGAGRWMGVGVAGHVLRGPRR